MNTPQKDKLNMFLKVRTFLFNNTDALSVLALIVTLRDELVAIINATIDAEGESSEDISGYTDLKEERHELVLKQALKVGRASALYFTFTSPDPVKFKKVDLLKSEIDGMRDTDLYTRVKKLFTIADPIKTLIVAPDFTDADVTNLQTLNESYFEVLEAPQDARSQRSSFNKEADRLLIKGDKLLVEKLDIAMATFAAGNQQLFEYYKSDRLIDDTGSRSELSGFDLQTYTIPGGSSISFGTAPAQNEKVYIKNNGPSSIGLCIQPTAVGNCTAPPRVIVQGEEFLGFFNDLGLGSDPGYVIITNLGAQEITIRAGLKPNS